MINKVTVAGNFGQSCFLRKKSLIPRKNLAMLNSTSGVNAQAFTGKNVLTSRDCSDNQNVKRLYMSIIPNAVPRLPAGGA